MFRDQEIIHKLAIVSFLLMTLKFDSVITVTSSG